MAVEKSEKRSRGGRGGRRGRGGGGGGRLQKGGASHGAEEVAAGDDSVRNGGADSSGAASPSAAPAPAPAPAPAATKVKAGDSLAAAAEGNEYLRLVQKRVKKLRKKAKRAAEVQRKQESGAALTAEQAALLANREHTDKALAEFELLANEMVKVNKKKNRGIEAVPGSSAGGIGNQADLQVARAVVNLLHFGGLFAGNESLQGVFADLQGEGEPAVDFAAICGLAAVVGSAPEREEEVRAAATRSGRALQRFIGFSLEPVTLLDGAQAGVSYAQVREQLGTVFASAMFLPRTAQGKTEAVAEEAAAAEESTSTATATATAKDESSPTEESDVDSAAPDASTADGDSAALATPVEEPEGDSAADAPRKSEGKAPKIGEPAVVESWADAEEDDEFDVAPVALKEIGTQGITTTAPPAAASIDESVETAAKASGQNGVLEDGSVASGGEGERRGRGRGGRGRNGRARRGKDGKGVSATNDDKADQKGGEGSAEEEFQSQGRPQRSRESRGRGRGSRGRGGRGGARRGSTNGADGKSKPA